MKLRVRMYRQGLGDCFLLTCSDGDKTSHSLIDCGVLKGTADAEKRMQDVAQSVHDTTGGHLDRLVVTHEHWDHLSGFLQAGAIYDTLEVGEVWLAWTEDPQDELANELRARKQKRLNGLVAAATLAQGPETPLAQRTALQLDALLGFQGDLGAAATKTTSAALEWVKGRQAPIKYLRPGDQFFDLPGLPGIRVYVLGPPHDSRLIKQSDPSKAHPEVYELAAADGSHQGFLEAAEALAEDEEPGAQPFDGFFRVEEKDARNDNELWKKYFAKGNAWRRIDHDWLGYAGALALQLDSDTNNTSLVLAFELTSGGDVVLFPGDAHGQIGRTARADGAVQGRPPREPQRNTAGERSRADGEQRAGRDGSRQPGDCQENELADAVPASLGAARGEDAWTGDGCGTGPRRLDPARPQRRRLVSIHRAHGRAARLDRLHARVVKPRAPSVASQAECSG
ncbi:MAG: hypothetical protein QOF27_497 [Gaiellaceae bacterium]|nr:hypothetical protein [Gaiellaceae bacterium]